MDDVSSPDDYLCIASLINVVCSGDALDYGMQDFSKVCAHILTYKPEGEATTPRMSSDCKPRESIRVLVFEANPPFRLSST